MAEIVLYMFGELMATGAVITGRCTFEQARQWAADQTSVQS